MKKILLCDPWIGELGYETVWAAVCRQHSKHYDFTVCATFEGREALYADFADLVSAHEFTGQSDGPWMVGFKKQTMDELVTDKIIPALTDSNTEIYRLTVFDTPFFKKGKIDYDTDKFGEFVKPTGMAIEYEGEFDIVVHARNRPHCDERSWDQREWHRLICMLKENGFKIATIGTDALQFHGCYTFNNAPLGKAISVINKSKLVLGESSGPMHVAMLCAKPVLVWWTGNSNNINKNRYLTKWNYHNSPVRLIGKVGYHPKAEDIYAETMRYMEQLWNK